MLRALLVPLGVSPVVLTHGNDTMEVGQGKTLIDVVRSCPSLYGDAARYVGTWWLGSLVCFIHKILSGSQILTVSVDVDAYKEVIFRRYGIR